MAEEERPNPQELLKAVERTEAQEKRGRLKIFLGMAAGVGKTYAMLEDAHHEKAEGTDVVIGIVNTHGRQETARLIVGLEMIPPKLVQLQRATFEELDLEKVLERKPELVLVDELAHTNIDPSMHPKRWQDVEQLLDSGINVSTTINIQHIESLKDTVEAIAEIPIRETVPDSILEKAASIELIDLTPEDLLQRLSEGKVYLGSQGDVAKEHFFQKNKLTALREIVLRFAAEKVDHELQEMLFSSAEKYKWKPRERLLVAVSQSPHSQRLLRATKRFAYNLNAPWIAVYVDRGIVLDEESKKMLSQNLALAQELGAEVITTQDSDIAAGIERIARQKQVTQIVIGRPPKRELFSFTQSYPLLDHLATECSGIDVHVIRQESLPKAVLKKKQPALLPKIWPYLFVLGYVGITTAINYALFPYIGYKAVGLVFLAFILLLSFFVFQGPLVFGALVSGLAWSYCFISPDGALRLESEDDIFLLFLFLFTAITIGLLTNRARLHKEMLLQREAYTTALYEIVLDIASKRPQREVLESIKKRLSNLMQGRFAIISRNADGALDFSGQEGFVLPVKEQAAAQWVFHNSKEAGWSTITLPASIALYIPLIGHKGVVGVLAFRPNRAQALITSEKAFLYTIAKQIAYYLEQEFMR
jgi:two-component system sensor histidine kinase KdpD